MGEHPIVEVMVQKVTMEHLQAHFRGQPLAVEQAVDGVIIQVIVEAQVVEEVVTQAEQVLHKAVKQILELQ
jgi:hypothetical protein